MKLTVTGRHVDISESFRSAVEEGLAELTTKHGVEPIDATVVLSKPTHLFHTDFTVHLGRDVILRASAEGVDAYASLTKAFDIIMQRLRRHKKLRYHIHPADKAIFHNVQTYHTQVQCIHLHSVAFHPHHMLLHTIQMQRRVMTTNDVHESLLVQNENLYRTIKVL